MPTPNKPTGGSPEQYDPYIANYGRKWSQMDPLTKRKLIEGAPVGGAGTGLSSRRIQEMVHHDVVPPWVGTGPMNTGYKRSGSQALEELKKIRRYAHPELFEESVQPFISPTPTPSVALADLAGSAALSSSSLDPFLFSPTSTPVSTSSALGDVLVPYNPDLGTVPIGDQAPVTVAAGTDPNIFSAQVEEPTTFSQGGAAMPGLGFRPLGYSTGTGPRGVEDDYIGNVISEFNNLFTNEQMTDVVDLVNANPKVFFARDLDPMVANIIQYLVTEGHVKRPPTADQITAETERVIAPPAPVGAGMDMPYPPEDLTDTFSALINPPQGTSPVGAQYQAGGHVGRGTMAGELGGRGDLSVRQAGETMQERWKRMHGYAGGGYASRGTVAGELPRYGHMSVREEGESMGELAKRHRDQDWYNRMGRGLGSLRRRMA